MSLLGLEPRGRKAAPPEDNLFDGSADLASADVGVDPPGASAEPGLRRTPLASNCLNQAPHSSIAAWNSLADKR